MTSLLFAHDHRFFVANGRKYSYTGGLNDEVLGRYARLADKVVVLARVDQSGGQGTRQVELKSTNIQLIDARGESVADLRKLVCESDLIIARLPSVVGMKIARLAKVQGKPYLVEVVGSAWDALWWHSHRGRLAAPYFEFATKRVVWEAPFVLYVTREFLQSRYPTCGEAVGVSDVECARVSERSLLARIERLRSGNRSGMVFGTCAAVDVKYKGQDQIIRTLGVLKRRGMTDYEYQLVGSGDTTRLHSIAATFGVSDQVKFLGTLPHDEVLAWLDRIDLYIQPSRQEGLPRALVEAMSRGLPCLGSTVGGIPELLDPAWMFSPRGDASKLLARMLEDLEPHALGQQVYRNYQVAGGYAREVLQAERSAFLEKYRQTCMGGMQQFIRQTSEEG